MARRSWLDRAVTATAAAVALLAARTSAAQGCSVTGPPSSGNTELSYKLGVTGAPSGAAYWLDCGYGTPAWDTNTSSIYCRYPAVGGPSGQSYPWTVTAAKWWDHTQVYCSNSGSITVYDCIIACSPSVPAKVEKDKPFTLQGNAATSHCRGDWLGDWQVTKGGVPWAQCPWESSCQVTLSPAGTYEWRFKAVAAWGDHGSFTEGRCETTGQVVVEEKITELRVGSLTFKATTITKTDGAFEYTLSGNVRVNDALQLGSAATFTGDPASRQGVLSTASALTVATVGKLGPVAILVAAQRSHAVDGRSNPGTITPTAPETLPLGMGFALNRVPLHLLAPIAVTSTGVIVAAEVFVGRETSQHLGSLLVNLGLMPGHGVSVLPGGRVIDGDGVPGLSIASASLAYDPVTDALTGTLDLHFPFLQVADSQGPADPRLGFVVEDGGDCIDTLDLAPEDGSGYRVQLRDGWRPYLDASGITVTGICNPPVFAPLFLGDYYFQQVADGPNLGAVPSAWVYRPPRTLALLTGTGTLIQTPVAGPTGFVALGHDRESFFLGGRFATAGPAGGEPVLDGALALGAIAWKEGGADPWRAYGTLTGTFSVSGSCACPQPATEACVLASTPLFGELQSESYSGATFTVTAVGRTNSRLGTAAFTGTGMLPDHRRLDASVLVANMSGGAGPLVSCWLGSNLAAKPAASPAPVRAARAATAGAQVTFAAIEEPAVFGCVGRTGTLPAITLRTPAGDVITPATAGRFHGVTYGADAANLAASFLVGAAAAGTWTLAAENLPATDASCSVLTVVPPPIVAFTKVQQDGASVALALSVSPPAATTLVSLFYSQSADGIPEGEIAAGVTADAGSVAATWNTSTVPTGSYFVFAVTEDGHNAPVVTIHEPAVEVVNGSLLPPSALHATRTSETATLAWTPSPSPDALGYTVLYTDDPDDAGWPFSAAASGTAAATVTGLDPRTSYRFAVVAWDAGGARSPRSNEVRLGPTIRLRRVVPR